MARRLCYKFLATSLKEIEASALSTDISGIHSPSIISGDKIRPALLLKTNDDCLKVLEPTVGLNQ